MGEKDKLLGVQTMRKRSRWGKSTRIVLDEEDSEFCLPATLLAKLS